MQIKHVHLWRKVIADNFYIISGFLVRAAVKLRAAKITLAAADWHIDGARCCWSSNWKHVLCVAKSRRRFFIFVCVALL
jgi:hypothetical protein